MQETTNRAADDRSKPVDRTEYCIFLSKMWPWLDPPSKFPYLRLMKFYVAQTVNNYSLIARTLVKSPAKW